MYAAHCEPAVKGIHVLTLHRLTQGARHICQAKIFDQILNCVIDDRLSREKSIHCGL